MKSKLICIVGPTGVGKSKVGVELALKLNGAIISADSMQVYRGLDIGTAKITELETKGVPHYLIDIVDPDDSFSVADFQLLAREKISEITARNKLPILVGGTGLYIDSLISPYKFQEHPINEARRAELVELASRVGNHFVHGLLSKVDPKLAAKLHPNDIRRVIRGIEYYESTGKKISSNYFQADQCEQESDFEVILIGLTMERQKLYERIELRIDEMINAGLVEEVKLLLDKGYSPELVSLQGLGYKEIIGYFYGEYSLHEGIRLLKRNTRRFAKRQFTWFNRRSSIKWFTVESKNMLEIVREISDYLGRTTMTLVE